MTGRLADRVAVITGATSGVGRAIARAFADEGARVALIARTIDGLEATAHECRARGAQTFVLPLDVSDADAVSAAADRIAAEWGRIDIWMNDAMVSVFAPAVEITPDEFRRVIEVNYLGYVHGTLAVLRHMRQRDAGVILQIGSALAYRSIPLQSAYCASKAAIRGFTDSLRSELFRERSGISLCMLQHPAVNTPQFEVVRSRLEEHPQPVPPIYQPKLVARVAVGAVLRPRREIWIGWSTSLAIVGTKSIPGLLDRYLARRAWESQETIDLPPGHPQRHERDNVDEPVPGGSRRARAVRCKSAPPHDAALGAAPVEGARALLRGRRGGARSPRRRCSNALTRFAPREAAGSSRRGGATNEVRSPSSLHAT